MNSMRKIQKILIGVFIGGVLMGGIGTGIAFVEYSSFAYAGEKTIGGENLVTRQFDHTFDPARGRITVDAGWTWEEYGHCQLIADESVPENVIRYEVTYNEKAVRPYLIYDEFEAEDGEGEFEEEEDEFEITWGEGMETTDIPDQTLDQAPDQIPDQTPDQLPDQILDQTPDQTSDQTPDQIPDQIPDQTPDQIPDQILDQTPNQIPDQIPEQIQGRVFLGSRYISNDFAVWMECKDDFLQELKQKKISYYTQIHLTDVKIKVNPATLPYVKNLSE